MIRLSDLPVGRKAVIRKFEPSSPVSTSYQDTDRNDIYLKLMEMGCVPGEEVSIVKVAPHRGPVSIFIAGYHLDLQPAEARWIWVEEVIKRSRVAY